MTPADGRQTVVDRLTALFSVWGAEQAIQFETSWWTWGDVGWVHASLRTALADRSVPDNVPIGIPTKLGSVGRALPGVELRVVDGILEVDPPQRASGLPAGWLRTNDRARIDADGFVWILGRADDVIVRGGFKVDLGQIEAALVAHPLVTEAFAVGLHDERLGEVPGALVVVSDLANRPNEAALIEWLREHLKPYEVPVRIRVVDAIPDTTTLKRHRSEARRLLAEARSGV